MQHGINVIDIAQIAEQASGIIMEIYRTSAPETTMKADNTPVTRADLEADQMITAALLKISSFPIISEENVATAGFPQITNSFYWLIDPLDGTKGFIARNEQFSVNIALMYGVAPVLGVVAAPAAQCVYAADEHVVWKRRFGGAPTAIRVRTMQPESFRFLISSWKQKPFAERIKARWPASQFQVLGSSLKFCVIAEGAADIYVRRQPTSEWDTAAAQCILERAGGKVETFARLPLRYNKGEPENPSFVAYGDATVDPTEFIQLAHG